MTKTQENLKDAFAGESQANRKYLAFAKKAEQEGLTQVAKLFRASADAETVHAHKHLRVLGGIRSTKENLKEAIAGETHEFTEMYPKMIEEAEAEGNEAAKISFMGANAVEKEHAGLYKKALESVEAGKDLEEKEIYVCQVCGHTVEDEAPDECPICKSKKEMFKKIE
ncbi:rubrerythrin family protein [candidate division KSB1 bacterium]